jgi:hypothetical protein
MFLVPFIIEHTIDHLYTFSFVLKDNVSINGLIVILKNISQCDVKHIMTLANVSFALVKQEILTPGF